MAPRTGFIYSIHHSSDPSKIYVGSTTGTLIKRLQSHKHEARTKTHCKSKWFEYLREHEYEGFRIQSIEEVKFMQRQELTIREDYFINTLKPALNSQNAVQNIEKVRENDKLYRQKNKERIALRDKKYREQNKDKMAERDHKYYNEQKSRILERNKTYRLQHKDQIKEFNAAYAVNNKNKYICEACNYSTYCFTHFNRHNQTKRHEQRVNNVVPPRILDDDETL
jgi:hypothetical protein